MKRAMTSARLRALLVDDSAAMRRQVKTVLELAGFESVVGVDSGFAALRHLAREAWVPDIVVVDLNMPSMDGVQLIRQLASQGCPARILILSDRPPVARGSASAVAQRSGLSVLG